MGKVAKLLPEEYKQKAIDNGIPLQTVYKRLQRNWELERAVTEKSKTQYINQSHRSSEGELMPGDKPKGNKVYSFTPYIDSENLLDEAIAKSGKSKSVFLADMVEEYLKKWTRKKRKIKK